ncbi:MAG TPA: sigma-70 family RNA polymerase sigma factor [Candidatus Paceibacterota bacterium]|nr:sigma-70 family RNA polymerase sigma factor [Candidatus Paceibacterota bacterium]
MSSKDFNNLAKRLKTGDAKAAGTIFDNFAPQLHRFFMARTSQRETAQDLTQEVFLKLVRNIKQFDPEAGDFTPWFWRVAHNTLIDHFRQKKPQQYLTDMEREGENIPDAMDSTAVRAELREVLEIVKMFSEEEQEIFEMYFLTDMAYAEIAKVTGKSESNLRVIIHRIRQKIIKRHE